MINETCQMCCNCAGYIKNWFWTYQWYCTEPVKIEPTKFGIVIIIILTLIIAYYIHQFIPLIMKGK